MRFLMDDMWISYWSSIGHRQLSYRPDHDELNALCAQADSLVSLQARAEASSRFCDRCAHGIRSPMPDP